MDAMVITGISRGRRWFRVEGAVGGESEPAHRTPGSLHVLDAADIAALAAGGRRVYFAQPAEGAPLVPLTPARAAAFDAGMLPVEELPRFAFLEHAGDEDIDTLLALRMGEDIGQFGLRLKRLEALEWVECDAAGRVRVSALGCELLRRWLTPGHEHAGANEPATPCRALPLRVAA